MASDAETLSPEKQSQILKGAAAVFADDGYEGASMSRIAARAGVSKGTLYNYFDGKSELFSAWVGQECDRVLKAVFDMRDVADDTEQGLREMGRRMLRSVVSPVSLVIYRMAVAEAQRFPELARAFYESGPVRATTHMERWLRGRVAAGDLVITDFTLAADQFFALCHTRIAMELRFGLVPEVTDADIATVVDATVAMFLALYGAKR